MSTATAIADALMGHFVHPDDPTSGVVLREVTAPGTQRRIDVLAMSLWPSRGYGIDAVEIKVSKADYDREIANPAKADPWWQYSNRFWIAAPSTLVADPAVLPPGWGLLVPGNGRRFKTIVKADERQLQPTMGLLAAILGRHVNASHDAFRRKYDDAREEQRRRYDEKLREAQENLAAGSDPRVRQALNTMREVEAAAGVAIGEWSYGKDQVTAGEFGKAVRIALDQHIAERQAARAEDVGQLVRDLHLRAARIEKAANDLAAAIVRGDTTGGGNG